MEVRINKEMVVLKIVDKKYVAIWDRKTDLQSNEWISFIIYFGHFKLRAY